MNFKEAIDYANQNPMTWLATTEGNQPHVRGLLLWYADETGFYYHTGNIKRIYDQLIANPKVELAFCVPGEKIGDGSMMRITGEVEFIEDKYITKNLFTERSWLNDVKAQFPDLKVVIFRVGKGSIQYWDMSLNCKEKEAEIVDF